MLGYRPRCARRLFCDGGEEEWESGLEMIFQRMYVDGHKSRCVDYGFAWRCCMDGRAIATMDDLMDGLNRKSSRDCFRGVVRGLYVLHMWMARAGDVVGVGERLLGVVGNLCLYGAVVRAGEEGAVHPSDYLSSLYVSVLGMRRMLRDRDGVAAVMRVLVEVLEACDRCLYRAGHGV